MALGGLATLTIILFVFVQLIQGLLLDVYLESYVCPAHSSVSQWYWVTVDGLLLLCWFVYLVAPTKSLKSPVRRKVCGVIPALAFGWAVYLAVVLLPRAVWIMEEAGRCLGKASALRSSSIQSAISGQIGNFSLLSQGTWGSNAWVTITSAGTTSLLVLLTITGHADHGLVKQQKALDFNLAEAAFAVIDGVEYWHAFFSAVEYDCKPNCDKSSLSLSMSAPEPLSNDTLSSTSALTTAAVSVSTSCPPPSDGQQQPTTDQLDYIRALDGNLGIFLNLVACASFASPFFALWEMQLKSEGKLTETNKSEHVPTSMEEVSRKKIKSRLKAISILFDLLCVNVPGFGVRIYLWLEYKQAISALITKNVLGIIFCLLQIWVKYVQPSCSKGKRALVRRATKKRIHVGILPQPHRASVRSHSAMFSSSTHRLFQADTRGSPASQATLRGSSDLRNSTPTGTSRQRHSGSDSERTSTPLQSTLRLSDGLDVSAHASSESLKRTIALDQPLAASRGDPVNCLVSMSEDIDKL